MPTLVAELSSLQRIWLYENQLPRGDSYEEKWNPPGNNNSSNFDASIFRSKQPPDRKRKILLPSDTTSRNVRANTNSNGPRFPYTQDKLTWRQSWENLKAYRDHYGNCNVPQKYNDNPKLGRWVNKQRKKKKNAVKYGALSKEQVTLLEELGFVWTQQP